MGIIYFFIMPGLYLLQLFNTKENCKIQSNNLQGAHIRGNYTVNDSHSGENFCGNAGDTTGGSSYTNSASSSANANSSSQSGPGSPPASQSAPGPPAPGPAKQAPAKKIFWRLSLRWR